MKLGFVSAILPELSLAEVLAFAATERFACVEIMCWPVGKAERKYAGITHLDVDGFTHSRAEVVHALCNQHGVSLTALGYYPNPLDPNPLVAKAAVNHLKKVIKAGDIAAPATFPTFADGHQEVTVCEAIIRSNQSQSWVKV